MIIRSLLLIFIQSFRLLDYVSCFSVVHNHQHHYSSTGLVTLSAESITNNNNDNDDGKKSKPNYTGDANVGANGKKKGYQFGDITKSFAKNVSSTAESSKKKGYQFGDISKSLGKKFAAKSNELTEKEGEYEFGDLSKWIDGKVKENVNKFTGKESVYEFGDLTKELVRRASTRDYNLEELFMLVKGILSLGISFSPVAGLLPVKVLVDLLNFSLINDVGNKAVTAVTNELDRRMKKAVTGDSEYQLGDKTKAGIKQFIGKEEYQFGDISKTVLDIIDENKKDKKSSNSSTPVRKLLEDSTVIDIELKNWDEGLWKSEKK